MAVRTRQWETGALAEAWGVVGATLEQTSESALGADRRVEASIHKEEETARQVYKELVWEVRHQSETDRGQAGAGRAAETKAKCEERR